MSAQASWNVSSLFERKGEGRPPVDILGLVAGLVVFAVVSFWIAFLAYFSGPVVEDEISPQIVASLQWSAVGVTLGVLAVFAYQRRPIGWYGTLIVTIVGLIQAIRMGTTTYLLTGVYVAIPLAVAALLLARRNKFFN